MSPTYGALKRRLRYAKYRLLGYSTSPPSCEDWDREYAAGAWQCLGKLNELAHYSAILGYCRFFHSRSILDVCCGDGVMTRMLQTVRYEAYHGIDVSAHAIAAAESRYGNAATRFFRAEAEAFRPERCFDTIIFNECLYYFEKPQALVRRYWEYVEPGGRMIISAFVSGQERALLRLIETEATMLDRTTVANRNGQRWIVSVFGERAV
jgi:2-polyprenyl-3-methyl-5-hydroxy-6-metoxy-1,4-benzoquinol methylase